MPLKLRRANEQLNGTLIGVLSGAKAGWPPSDDHLDAR
jgi:hypothetical protein